MRQYLKNLRHERKLKQKDLAELIELSPTAYCMIENGERRSDMSLSLMQKLANALNVSLETIVKAESKYYNEPA